MTAVTISEEAELNAYKESGLKFPQIQIAFPFNHLFIETHLCRGLSMKSTSKEYFRQNWVLSSCTGSQEPLQRSKHYMAAN